MLLTNPIQEHRDATRSLARSLKRNDIYRWLVECGYFPESYVLPPCFVVKRSPKTPKAYTKVTKGGKGFALDPSECVSVHFPKSDLTDRTFGIMHPEIHNDIAYYISRNWKKILSALIPADSDVTAYSFPIPIDAKAPGRVGHLRSGRLIYEFIGMVDDDLASIAYRYTHLVRTDIKSFYPSIYTHSIAWALHGKKFVRRKKNLHNYNLLGNRLDRLFQYANDRCTNGVPIGPVVSDIVAEIIAAAVDVLFSKQLRAAKIECQVVRFKDDYRMLVKSDQDGRKLIKFLQAALKEYNLELNEGKTAIWTLPEGLFRDWVSKYHAAHPKKRWRYRWKEFRELYLSVLRIDQECPGTGVIDRFLADIVSKNGNLKVDLAHRNLQKVLSMLIMLATRRTKAFPKIVAIIESVLRSPLGTLHKDDIVAYLEAYLSDLSKDEGRNKYLIAWISYFLVSNGLKPSIAFKPKYKDSITRSVFNNRAQIFKSCKDFQLFVGSGAMGKKMSMLEHLEIFSPPPAP